MSEEKIYSFPKSMKDVRTHYCAGCGHGIVHKLIAYTERILNYCEGVSFDAFTSDSMLTDACVFNLSQMVGTCKTR